MVGRVSENSAAFESYVGLFASQILFHITQIMFYDAIKKCDHVTKSDLFITGIMVSFVTIKLFHEIKQN